MNKNIFLILAVLTLYFFDIANPDALRQGTEGFYLKISNEMFNTKSFLTPLIYGEHHWSKPPLHFLFPMPFYALITNNYLFAARLSIAFLSLVLIGFISLWYQKELKRNWFEAFIFLVTPVYFFKYSRIFMMEMPLALLSTLGALYFYSYVKSKNIKTLLWGSLITSLSVLIKGPVSLFLIAPGCFFYCLKNKKGFAEFVKYFFIATFLSSIWFIASSFKHGLEFFNYFFIRENLGKFQSKSYPITSVIQGLLIFSFPVILYLPSILKNFKKTIFKNELLVFLILNFIFFYFLWFIPKQRSHHYAVPSIPIFLIFCSYCFFNLKEHLQVKLIKRTNFIYSLFIIFLATLILLGIYLDIISIEKRAYLLGSFFITALWFKKSFFIHKYSKLLKPLVFTAFLWNFAAPLFYLPILPVATINKINSRPEQTLNINFRKPFFIEQQVNIKTQIIRSPQSDFKSLKTGDLLLAPVKTISKHLKLGHKTLNTWRTWKRGAKASLITKALTSKKLELIQQNYALIQID